MHLYELTDDRIHKIFDRNFRAMIVGGSGTGKSFFLTQKILPVIHEQYDRIFVFTKPPNINYYEMQTWDLKANKETRNYKKPWIGEGKPVERFVQIETNIDRFESIINLIGEDQHRNRLGFKDDGETIYKYRVLMIFDDIAREKFNKSNTMIDVFTNYRHYNVDTVFLIQSSTVIITPQMTNNIDVFIMSRMGNTKMRNTALYDFARDALQTIDMKDDQGKELVKDVYKDICDKNDYGILIIDMRHNKALYHTRKVKAREIRGWKPPKIIKPDDKLLRLPNSFELSTVALIGIGIGLLFMYLK